MPLAGRALDRDGAAVQPDQFLHQRQADAGALVGAAPLALDAVEALEQRAAARRPGCRRRCRAPISSAPSPTPRAARRAMPPVEGELERVRQQVEDDLLPHVAVDVDRLGQRRAVDQRGAGRRARTPSGSRWPARRSGAPGRPARSRAWTRPASMREKSSSALTSLQQPQRVAVRQLEPLALRRRQRRRARPARPRAAPASASAGCGTRGCTLEKNAVLARSMLGQRLGALAFRLVGASVGQRRAELPRRPGRGSRDRRRRAAAAG